MRRIADLEARLTPAPTAACGKPGRTTVNYDIAAFANERRPGMTWKAIYYAWKREHPADRQNKELTPGGVPGAWRRRFGGKGKRDRNEMWAH